MTEVAFPSRHERFESIPSTNDVVREWLAAGTAEVCLAVAGEQTAGRGRSGRTWVAPSGTALLLSLGFRPTYLAAAAMWRLAAIVSLAMADAAEDSCGLRIGTIRLKWPNDLVVERGGGLLKIAGVLGETEGAGTADPRAVVGIGINADWPRDQFPAELAETMTSLREAAAGLPVDVDSLLEAFLGRLETRVAALRAGHFDVAGWHDRQVTTGRIVRLEGEAGALEDVLAVGVDGATGALIVAGESGREREVVAGEVVHVRPASRPLSGDDGVTP